MLIIEYVLFMPIISENDIVGINAFYGQVHPKEQAIVHEVVHVTEIWRKSIWHGNMFQLTSRWL